MQFAGASDLQEDCPFPLLAQVTLLRKGPAAAKRSLTGAVKAGPPGGISASTLSNYRKPIGLLLEMNGATAVNWRKLGRLTL